MVDQIHWHTFTLTRPRKRNFETLFVIAVVPTCNYKYGDIVFINQATWEEAQRACRAIGTDLVSVEYAEKDRCITKLATSRTLFHDTPVPSVQSQCILVYWSIRGTDFWTSGTDQGSKGRNHWCSINKGITNLNMTWSGATEGDCISVNFGNQSVYSKTPCTNQLNYICEVTAPLKSIFC